MNGALFEQLLSEEEGSALDFKRDQYRFTRATEDEKSELLKDILGFTNAWRRSEAYILMGVEDVRGGRGNVVGIPPGDHLDDHSLQQFVNSLTNRPVRFRYEAFGFEGKQVGIIHVEDQERPVYLTQDFGKLRRNEVYVRRGSSTDPQKPATPEEIARMGLRSGPQLAELCVEFADAKRDDSLGTHISWNTERCEMPTPKSIPDLKADRGTHHPYGFDLPSLNPHNQTNLDYYRQRARYEFAKRLFRPVRLAVTNVGQAAANSVRTELLVPDGGVIVFDPWELPGPPRRRAGIDYNAVPRVQPAIRRSPGEVTIDRNDTKTRIAIEYGNLQPGRRVRSDALSLGILTTGDVVLTGQIFADNLPQPKSFTLMISATVDQTRMTVAELTESAALESDE